MGLAFAELRLFLPEPRNLAADTCSLYLRLQPRVPGLPEQVTGVEVALALGFFGALGELPVVERVGTFIAVFLHRVEHRRGGAWCQWGGKSRSFWGGGSSRCVFRSNLPPIPIAKLPGV